MANTPADLLHKVYGYPVFRGQQAAVVAHVIAGEHALVLMPTGGGKSLCYQIPALCRSGVGVIVSPLIALMQDQVSALAQLGLRAAALHSGILPADMAQVKHRLLAGELDFIYVAPERLLMPEFMEMLQQVTVALFAIDEAHCMSQWGHDFRPHYAQLSELVDAFPDVPRLGLTATADALTRRDILASLQIPESGLFVSGFDRPNIHYTIVEKRQAKQQVLRFIAQNHAKNCGIIYCLSRSAVEETADWLTTEGYRALPYHAGLPAGVRAANQARFLREDAVIMVATVAFGMGINKPDVRFVVHMNLPKNIEAYYQETGRAGRDSAPAEALLLYGMGDVVQQRLFIDQSNAPERQKQIEYRKLRDLVGLCETGLCRRQVLLRYFGERAGEGPRQSAVCSGCDNCERPPEMMDATIEAQKALSCVIRTGQRFGMQYLIDVLCGKLTDRMAQFGHQSLPTFGIGAAWTRVQWRRLFEQLIVREFLRVDHDAYGGIKLTQSGGVFLKERQRLQVRKAPVKPAKAAAKTHFAADLPTLNEAASKLLQALKDKRRQLAQDQNVPAYMIFHDKTLQEIARHQPADLSSLLQISGVGQHKADKYGEAIIALVKGYI